MSWSPQQVRPPTRAGGGVASDLGAADVELGADDLAEIENVASAIQVRGARYPEHLERMTGR